MEVLMKFEAMMKIRMAGVRARDRKATTSLALKRAPSTFWRRSKASLTRLRKRRRTRRRKTIRFRLNSANTTRFEARGTWGEWIHTLKPHQARARRASPPTAMSRLRRQGVRAPSGGSEAERLGGWTG